MFILCINFPSTILCHCNHLLAYDSWSLQFSYEIPNGDFTRAHNKCFLIFLLLLWYNIMSKAIYRMKVLPFFDGSRGIRIYSHHNKEARKQVDTAGELRVHTGTWNTKQRDSVQNVKVCPSLVTYFSNFHQVGTKQSSC